MSDKSTGESGDKKPDAANNCADHEPSWVTLCTDTNPQADKHKKEAAPPNWVEKWTFWVLVFAAFAACWAAFEADRLANLTSRALVDARNSAQSAHDDTIRAENLTADSLGLARESTNAAAVMARVTSQSATNYIAAERGQFVADNMQITGLKQAPDKNGLIALGITFNFTNFGRSPVHMMDYNLMGQLGKLSPRPKYGPPVETLYNIGPTGTWHSVKNFTGLNVTTQQATEIMHDVLPVFLYGWIRYRDTFGKIRKTCFAYTFAFEGNELSVRFSPGGPSAYWCDE